MTSLLSPGATATAFLLTYLIHSTCAILLSAMALRFCLHSRADLRVLLGKATLVIPLLTTFCVISTELPHCGAKFMISDDSAPIPATSAESGFPERGADAIDAGLESPFMEQFTATAREGRSPGMPDEPLMVERLQPAESPVTGFPGGYLLLAVWIAGASCALLRLAVQAWRLQSLRNRATPVTRHSIRLALDRLSLRAGLRQAVELLRCASQRGPLTAGIRRPFILVPGRILSELSVSEQDALLAHELSHVARRDSLWNLISQAICGVCFFQPLNRLVRRRLQMDMEFLADQDAARLLEDRTGLVRCLARLGEMMSGSGAASPLPLAAGMATFRSTLGRRVECLLEDNAARPAGRFVQMITMIAILTSAVLTMTLIPKAVAQSPAQSNNDERSPSMTRSMTAIALMAGLAMPLMADDEKKTDDTPREEAPLKATPDALPDGSGGFGGVLVGRLAAKDVERGTLVLNVQAVPRVWNNNRAGNPKGLIGRAIEVEGISGKHLDTLLTTRLGDTLEVAGRQEGDGNRLIWPGEMFRKVEPFDPDNYPELPDAFRGFHGAVAATILSKDADLMMLIIEVDRVLDTWKQNKSENPESIQGRQISLAGFWRRQDQYHALKVGDQIEVGLQHQNAQSDSLTVAEFVRKAGSRGEREMRDREMRPREGGDRERGTNLAQGINGFSGMIAGRLVEKDVEKGTFTVAVDAVPRVWRNNKADNPRALVGNNIHVDGVFGKWLDVLLLVREGETLEFEAKHDGGERLTFPGELLRKIEPVKAGDYPELPEGFRGFRGALAGTIVKKDAELMEMTVKATAADAGRESDADKVESIIDEEVMLIGFWRHQDRYHDLKIGDTIQCEVQHIQRRSDHLTVSNFKVIEKSDGERERD